MKFGHLVKYNGEYYPAGTDVPVEDKSNTVDIKEKKEVVTPKSKATK